MCVLLSFVCLLVCICAELCCYTERSVTIIYQLFGKSNNSMTESTSPDPAAAAAAACQTGGITLWQEVVLSCYCMCAEEKTTVMIGWCCS